MIVVFGSINIDFVFRTNALPAEGETVLTDSFATVPGGKGANHAVAAARASPPGRPEAEGAVRGRGAGAVAERGGRAGEPRGRPPGRRQGRIGDPDRRPCPDDA